MMHGRRQPQRIPPPIDHGSEALDAELVLREFSDGFGLLLWKTVRTVSLWAELSPQERGRAFGVEAFGERTELLEESRAHPELRGPLEQTAQVLKGGRVDAEQVADACRAIAEWAQNAGASGTALEFMQAAAFASPRDASLANMVARYARQRAEYARAETWYRQAISVARQTRDRRMFGRSFLGLGIVYLLRGNYPAARKSFIRALRAGQRYSLRPVIADAYHELAVVAVRSNKASDVVRYARLAMEAYGPGHPWLPMLAHDVAVFWMSRGYFAQALRVFRSIPPGVGAPGNQLAVSSCLARAAAGAGDMATYEDGVQDTMRLLDAQPEEQRVVSALLDLTHAAQSVGDYDSAATLARWAQRLAKERGEAERLLEAEGLIDAIEKERQSSTAPAAARAVPRPVERLAGELEAAMHAAPE